jgi:hypothetical protein
VISFLFNLRSCVATEAKLNSEDGFPHSEIVGSKLAHSSPTLIAACHVLHRLYMPRHPPNALTSHLRVHTTNDNAVRAQKELQTPSLKLWIILSQPDNFFDYITAYQMQASNMPPRHRLKNPFTMSKNGGKSAKSTPEGVETVVFISGKFCGFQPRKQGGKYGGA